MTGFFFDVHVERRMWTPIVRGTPVETFHCIEACNQGRREGPVLRTSLAAAIFASGTTRSIPFGELARHSLLALPTKMAQDVTHRNRRWDAVSCPKEMIPQDAGNVSSIEPPRQ